MTYEDLEKLYERKKKVYGKDTFKHVSEILSDAKKQHKKDFKGVDHEQSWRSFKGKNLEKLIEHIIVDGIHEIGLEVVNGNILERTVSPKLPDILWTVKKNLLIDYAEFGCHLPDVDIIVFNPKNGDIVALLSVKVTLRERIAQTGYWKFKLLEDKHKRHIKVFFVTPDEDGTLNTIKPCKKARAIVETDLDGSYVLTDRKIETSGKVKLFDKLITDLKKVQKERK